MKVIVLLLLIAFLGIVAAEAECSNGNCRAIQRYAAGSIIRVQ